MPTLKSGAWARANRAQAEKKRAKEAAKAAQAPKKAATKAAPAAVSSQDGGEGVGGGAELQPINHVLPNHTAERKHGQICVLAHAQAQADDDAKAQRNCNTCCYVCLAIVVGVVVILMWKPWCPTGKPAGWHLGCEGQSCDEVCESCVDGKWLASYSGTFAEALKEAGEDCNSMEGCDWYGCPDCDFCENGIQPGIHKNFPGPKGVLSKVGYPAFGTPIAEGKHHIDKCWTIGSTQSSCAASSDEDWMQDN
eukprot:COSAG01_NODE_16279_length_1251_cov_1.888889_1_plen_250_part_01